MVATAGTLLLAGCTDDSPAENDAGDGGGGGSDGEDGGSGADPTDSPTPEPTDSPTPDYSTSRTETFSIEGESGAQVQFDIPVDFILQWSVRNELSQDLDFDVFLFTESEYQEYVDTIRGDSADPDYIADGTIQGIREQAGTTATLRGGEYRLVIDNSDYGDAGDFGEESTRRVTLSVETRRN